MPCGQPLELYADNQQKQMLRCSDAQARRRDDHKSVAYFAAKEDFGRLPMAKLASRATPKISKSCIKIRAVTSSISATHHNIHAVASH